MAQYEPKKLQSVISDTKFVLYITSLHVISDTYSNNYIFRGIQYKLLMNNQTVK